MRVVIFIDLLYYRLQTVGQLDRSISILLSYVVNYVRGSYMCCHLGSCTDSTMSFMLHDWQLFVSQTESRSGPSLAGRDCVKRLLECVKRCAKRYSQTLWVCNPAKFCSIMPTTCLFVLFARLVRLTKTKQDAKSIIEIWFEWWSRFVHRQFHFIIIIYLIVVLLT